MADLKNALTGYPAAIDTHTDEVDNVDYVDAASVNNPVSAILAIETELGTNPSGAYATVAAALTDTVFLTGNQTIAGVKTFSTAGGAVITGVTDGTSAAAGKVGEVISISRTRAAAPTTGTGVTVNITASPLVLTAGRWMISGVIICLMPNGTGISGGVSRTSATRYATATGVPSADGQFDSITTIPTGASNEISLPIPPYPFTFSGADVTLYLVGVPTATGDSYLYGYLQAVRIG